MTFPFDTVLVANRGEIAVRVIRTLRRLGLRSVAVYSDADAGALHVRLADGAVRLGPAAAAESYLSIDRVLEAARRTGAQAIHPGFGFLAENAAFARACAAAGIVFIGPGADAIAVMGDKISAKQTVAARGVPVVPGIARPGLSDDDLVAAAADIGFPVLVKPSAGGGGKGMHVLTDADGLRPALAAARREAAAGFGDDTLFLERYVSSPRHIEVQVLADTFGSVVHLGERECSLQRRHQKVIEEAPSPLLSGLPDGEELRRRLGEAACETARSVDYVGAGTVEFIVSADAPDEFFFMEMNTRLQVEHPVTEEVTGLDLVELQVRIAAGMPLPLHQDDIALTGHSIEARVYAEDPREGFLPTGGRVERVIHPEGDGIRVDSGLADGLDVAVDYDPMIAKVIAWAPDRETARRRLVRALADTAVLGFETNLEYLRLLLEEPRVVAGDLDTDLIARTFEGMPFAAADDRVCAEAALVEAVAEAGDADGTPWQRRDGWRLGAPAPRRYRLTVGPRTADIAVWGELSAARVQVDGGDVRSASVSAHADGTASVVIDDAGRRVRSAPGWLHVDGATFRVAEATVARGGSDESRSPQLVSPMPGTVVLVSAADGDRVEPGDPVVSIEAMKMEHVLRSTVAGVVRIAVAVGDQVTRGAIVATVDADESTGGDA
ncbi:MAG: biotin carboxylase N-terminal domain-containing protein [Candidatus Microbacterium phytovorans]|uniref:biotin carboxylase n=1 Tax=Candidatus Microbacterium phytovorans TaxID=3121374 RepID=A0AAJ5VZN0_9MICO|nr:biotin carboxylase N-terminal domain-containing protein [Microbacterium sp.]WEK12820.1 MAG: biotin carboxylase N-terminal domain-containing protein [Microbacterium sp.]